MDCNSHTVPLAVSDHQFVSDWSISCCRNLICLQKKEMNMKKLPKECMKTYSNILYSELAPLTHDSNLYRDGENITN